MIRRVLVAAAVAAALTASSADLAWAKAGDLDRSFADGGRAFVDDPGGAELRTNDVVVQPSGRVVTIGSDRSFNDQGVQDSTRLLGLTTSGALDPSFGAGGWTSFDEGRGEIPTSAAVDPDGSIIVAGSDFQGRVWLARFLSSGNLDFRFGESGVEQLPFYAGVDGPGRFGLATDRIGRIVFATLANGQVVVTRRLASGSPDPSFSGDGFAELPQGGYGRVESVPVAVTPDDRVVVGSGGVSGFTIYRLTEDGRPDPTFGSHGATTAQFGGYSDWLEDLAIAPDGSVVLAGYVYYEGNTAGNYRLRMFPVLSKLSPKGKLDREFGRAGVAKLKAAGTWSSFAAVAIQRRGGIVAVGSSAPKELVDYSDLLTARYKPDGSRDRSFSDDGFATVHTGPYHDPHGVGNYDGAVGVALDSRGRIVVAGEIRRAPLPFQTAVIRYLGR